MLPPLLVYRSASVNWITFVDRTVGRGSNPVWRGPNNPANIIITARSFPSSRRKELSDMSAPQIPNLNTLRRGGGRGRLRGRGGVGTGTAGEERHGLRGIAAQDRVVQGTDNDASVSRLSAVEIGYLEDPFAKALTPPGSETRRLPIINRGKQFYNTVLLPPCRLT